MKKNLYFLTAGMLAVTVGCAAYPEDEFLDYEELPAQPYAVPVAEDDKPGRSVDEMLGMKPRPVYEPAKATADSVSVQTAAPKKPKPLPDVEGRFGSKEKRHLRKGLNAPADSMVYDEQTRKDIIVVRGLDVKPLTKEDEQKILDGIVAAQDLKALPPAESRDEKKAEAVKAAETAEKPAVGLAVSAPAQLSVAEKGKIAPVSEEEKITPAPEKKNAEKIVLKAPAAVAPVVPSEPVSLAAPVLTQPREKEFDFELKMMVQPEAKPAKQAAAFELKPPVFAENPSEDAAAVPAAVNLSLLQNTIAFAKGQTKVSEKDVFALLAAARAYKAQSSAVLRVIGYDYPVGGDKSAAKRRAQNVADVLSANGVPKAHIVIETVNAAPFGENEGRHVEIYLEY